MKIQYFYQYFATPKGSWGTRVYEFASEWVKEGHEVEVITSIYSKSDLEAVKLIETQWFEGIKVKIINVRIDNKQSTPRRIYTFIMYLFVASYYALFRRADVAIASSGPISVGFLGLLCKMVGKKLLFEVRDLWPDTAIAMDVIRNATFIKLLRRFEKRLYKKADHIVCLSPGMKEFVIKRSGKNTVSSIPNAANLDLFTPNRSGENPLGSRYGIYYGNLGKINNTGLLIDTAVALKKLSISDFKILLIGDGPMKEDIIRHQKEQDLDNLILLGLMPKDQLVNYIQHATVAFVPLNEHPILATSSPNKLFEALACGVAVIQNTNGWISDFLEKHDVGFTVGSSDVDGMVQLIRKIDSDEFDDEATRQKARELAVQEFDKVKLAATYLDVIKSMHS